MAKRVRRPNLPSETLERARRELQRSGELPEQPVRRVEIAEAAPPPPIVQTAPAARVRAPADLRREYSYVLSDLKNMAMLAAAFMSLLVVLSFFI
jgi:hypothetical protein